jgi:hypothetical protein
MITSRMQQEQARFMLEKKIQILLLSRNVLLFSFKKLKKEKKVEVYMKHKNIYLFV